MNPLPGITLGAPRGSPILTRPAGSLPSSPVSSSGILSPERPPICTVPPSTGPDLGIPAYQRRQEARDSESKLSKMITKYITGITTSFSPFNPRSGKTIRNFLASLPPNARSTMRIGVKMFGQNDAAKPAILDLTFNQLTREIKIEDGREMKLDVEKMKFRDIQTEVDRHSRALRRKEELDA
ncbi:hypothetical protein D0862_05987 [Hortaea werneckii]|uniref:Large ribosomal subunit protein mL53 n=1 Tax=Hortaea werneckii TaxID=91943 RepID=A0A3M7GN36_HORWE|nr:hypothetical protein D0862_05987 [Hortaea werneckii]